MANDSKVRKLGQIKGLHINSTAPSNTSMIWYDTGSNTHKVYNTGSSSWVAIAATSLNVPIGPSIIAVSKSGNDGTGAEDDLSTPYLTIGAAYTQAKTLTPSSTNPITIIVYGGTYTESVAIDTNYINIISANSFHNEENTSVITQPHISGTLTVTANSFRLNGMSVLTMTLTGATTDNYVSNSIIGTVTSTLAKTMNWTHVTCSSFLTAVGDNQLIEGVFDNCELTGLAGEFQLDAEFHNCKFGNGSVAKGAGAGTFTGEFSDCSFGNNCITVASVTTDIGVSITAPMKISSCTFGTGCVTGIGEVTYAYITGCTFSSGSLVDTTGTLQSTVFDSVFDTGAIDYLTISNSLIKGCLFTGDGNIEANTYAVTSYIEDCHFRGDGSILIKTGGTHSGYVTNCVFQNQAVVAVTAGNAHTVTGLYKGNRGLTECFGTGANAIIEGWFHDCHVGVKSFGAGGAINEPAVFDNCTYDYAIGGTLAQFADGTLVGGKIYRLSMRTTNAATAVNLANTGAMYYSDILNAGAGEELDGNVGAAWNFCQFSKVVGAAGGNLNNANNVIVTAGMVFNSEDGGMI
jgi:hypothetical protein